MMKSFVRTIIIFLLPLIAILTCIDVAYTRQLHCKHIREIETWDRILGDSINSDLFILGSSRAMCHYNPQIIDSITGLNSYNFGLDGKTLEADIALFNILKNHIKDYPRYLIWDIWYGCFEPSPEFGDKQYTPYLYNKEIWREVNKYQQHFLLSEKFLPIVRYWRRNAFPSYNSFIYSYKGYSNPDSPWSSEALNPLIDKPIEYSINPYVRECFRNTIRELKSKGTKVFLVLSPIYYEGKSCIANAGELFDSIRLYALQEKCTFLDYTNDALCYDTSYFYNAMHMNRKGSKKFSQALAQELVSSTE